MYRVLLIFFCTQFTIFQFINSLLKESTNCRVRVGRPKGEGLQSPGPLQVRARPGRQGGRGLRRGSAAGPHDGARQVQPERRQGLGTRRGRGRRRRQDGAHERAVCQRLGEVQEIRRHFGKEGRKDLIHICGEACRSTD